MSYDPSVYYQDPASSRRRGLASHPAPPWAMGAPLYYPASAPQAPAPAPARLSQKVRDSHGNEHWATYDRKHKSIVLKKYDKGKHHKGLADKNNKKVRKNHHGFVVHDGKVLYIDKGKVEVVRDLHAHEHKKGEKHHGKYKTNVAFHMEKSKVSHPLLTALSNVIKSVRAKGKHRKDEPVPAFPDLTEYHLNEWFQSLGELHAEFNNPNGKGVFRGKSKYLKWPAALEARSISPLPSESEKEKYVEFSKQAGRIESALRRLLWSAKRQREESKPEREAIRNVLNRHGLHKAGEEVPDVDEAVYQLTKSDHPRLQLSNHQELVLILSHYIVGKSISLEATNAKGKNAPMSPQAFFEFLKDHQVIDEKTSRELFRHNKTLVDIMKAARAIRKSDKNRQKRAEKKGLVPPSEAQMPPAVAPTPLVSMLYHRS